MDKRNDLKTLKINISVFLISVFILTLMFCFSFYKEDNLKEILTNDVDYSSEYSQGDVEINSENFPDEVFRQWLLDPENLQGAGSDGVLTEEELMSTTSIQYRGQTNAMIADLKGIEFFTSLQELSVPYNALTSLDLSKNVNLTYVNCSYNKLTSLNVTQLSKLSAFYCEFNYLKELDLSGNPELTIIYCRHNVLETLDFTNNTKLKFIETFDNKLKDIDVSMLSELEFLHIDHNKLTRLDMSHNLKLKGGGFVVRNNDIRELILPVIPDFTVYYDDFAEQDPITGYERLEWFSDPQYTLPVQGDVKAEGQTLYGKRLPNDYTIKFQGSGIGYPSSVSAVYDGYAVLPEQIPSRRGYQFVGWCKDINGKDTVYGANESVINIGGKIHGDSVTLYAQWKPIVYTIEFSPNAQGVQGSVESISAEYGKSYVLPSNGFERAGYDFLGWAKTPTGQVVYKGDQSVENLSYAQGENIVLYAVWELNSQETQKPYLAELKKIFDNSSAGAYFSEDRNVISESYTVAYNAIIGAQKDKTLMQKALDDYALKVSEVPTKQERIQEIASGWENEFNELLTALNDPPITLENGTKYLETTKEALKKSSAENIAGYSSLVQKESREQAAEKALEVIQESIVKLQKFLPVGEWLSEVKNNTETPYSEVLPSHYAVYYGLLQKYDRFDDAEKEFFDKALVSEIKERLNIAEAKESALNSLETGFKGYKEENYSSEKWGYLKNLYESYLQKINNSASLEEIDANLTLGLKAFDEVPAKDEETETPDTDGEIVDSGDNGNSGAGNGNGNDNNVMLAITLAVIVLVLVIFVSVAVILRLRYEKKKNGNDD